MSPAQKVWNNKLDWCPGCRCDCGGGHVGMQMPVRSCVELNSDERKRWRRMNETPADEREKPRAKRQPMVKFARAGR